MGNIRKVVQLVPYRRRNPDGIGDYSRILADAFDHHYQLKTLFISSSPQDNEGDCVDPWPTSYLAAKDARALLSCLNIVCDSHTLLVLHLSSYGYEKRGIPFWLVLGLQRFAKKKPKAMIATVFHELSANSTPLHSAYWLGWLQKRIARRLFDLSTAAITPSGKYHAELKSWSPDKAKQVMLAPVFSNVGEPDCMPDVQKRGAKLVVFGRADSRLICYSDKLTQLEGLVAKWKIDEIVDIGVTRPGIPDKVGNCPVRQTGVLAAEEISIEMLSSRLGVLSYDSSRLGKSTIFAAYAAHGLQIICFDENNVPGDRLINGKHLLVAPPVPVWHESYNSLSEHAWSWYREHNTKVLASRIGAFFELGLPEKS